VLLAHEFWKDGERGAELAPIQSQLLVNGLSVATGTGLAWTEPRWGRNIVEGVALDTQGKAGVWRFSLRQGFQAGSIEVLEGQLVDMAPESIAFRLTGRNGQRVVFAFGARP
jgi:hypothetical protein